MRRIRTDPHGHLRRLDDPLIAIVPQRESIGRQGKRDFFGFARGQRYSLKTLQRANRLSHARSHEPDIELNDLFARTRARVRDVGTRRQRSLARPALSWRPA